MFTFSAFLLAISVNLPRKIRIFQSLTEPWHTYMKSELYHFSLKLYSDFESFVYLLNLYAEHLNYPKKFWNIKTLKLTRIRYKTRTQVWSGTKVGSSLSHWGDKPIRRGKFWGFSGRLRWFSAQLTILFLFRIQGTYSSDPHNMRQQRKHSKMRLSPNTGVPSPWTAAHYKAMAPSELSNASSWPPHAHSLISMWRYQFPLSPARPSHKSWRLLP